MPKLSVWLVRTALVYMGIGFLFGALILFNKGIPVSVWLWRLLNPHLEMMIYGWTMQFVMGVAYWILPRFSGKDRYGRTYLGWWSFGLLNGGLLLAMMDGWFGIGWPSTLGHVFILMAVVAFVAMMWPRVKPLSDTMGTINR